MHGSTVWYDMDDSFVFCHESPVPEAKSPNKDENGVQRTERPLPSPHLNSEKNTLGKIRKTIYRNVCRFLAVSRSDDRDTARYDMSWIGGSVTRSMGGRPAIQLQYSSIVVVLRNFNTEFERNVMY
jgi:hypothetical protein